MILHSSGYNAKFNTLFNKSLDGKLPFIPLVKHAKSDELSKLGTKLNYGKSMYLLFGGMSGSGKTAVVDTQFVLNPYLWWLRNKDKTTVKFRCIYRSMERSLEYKIAKWRAYLMYIDHNILIDVPTIFSMPTKMYDLTPELTKIIRSYDDFFKEMEKYIHIIPGSENPTGVRNYGLKEAYNRGWHVKTRMEKGKGYVLLNGQRHECPVYLDEERGVSYTIITIGKKNIKVDMFSEHYFPMDEDEIVIHVTDHIGELSYEKGLDSEKKIVDKHAEYMKVFRDIFGWTILDIQQLNRGIEDYKRRIDTVLDVTPKDFHGSGDPFKKADGVIGLINPYKLDLAEYIGYDVTKLVDKDNKNRFRGMRLIKNSWGIDDLSLGFQFLGENGFTYQLPIAEDLDTEMYDSIRDAKIWEEINKNLT